MVEYQEVIAKRFLSERVKINANRSEFARLCGLPMGSIRGWEEGKSIPAHAIKQLRDAGINTDYVLFGKEKDGNPTINPSVDANIALIELQKLILSAHASMPEAMRANWAECLRALSTVTRGMLVQDESYLDDLMDMLVRYADEKRPNHA